jgi:hypothetical protein
MHAKLHGISFTLLGNAGYIRRKKRLKNSFSVKIREDLFVQKQSKKTYLNRNSAKF